MPPTIFKPTTEEEWLALRAQDVTSTEIAALFNCSPYTTAFELWHSKKNNTITALEPNERMKWGTRLQNSIAQGVGEEQGWTLRALDRFMYARVPEHRIGASFDFSFTAKDGQKGLLEIKNVDGLQFLQGWQEQENGFIEAPLHIEMQVQHQLLVSGHKQAYIGALVGGNRLVLIRREADPAVHAGIIAKADEFWKSIDAGIPPEPDFAKDADFIRKLYRFAEPGRLLNATEDMGPLVTAYKTASAEAKAAEEKKDAAKAELLTKIGKAEKVLGNGWTISAGMVAPTRVEAYDRAGFRTFRINFKKEKA